MTDGFSGYNKLRKNKKVRIANCWSHARREFFDLKESYPEKVFDVVSAMDELFEVERRARSFKELGELRKMSREK